jgi:hypothetical protein
VTTPASILRFWEAIEYLSPQAVPNIDPRDREAPVYRISDDGILPWESGHQHTHRRPPGDTKWRHTLYVGVFQLEEVRLELERRFGVIEDDIEEGKATFSGNSALFAFSCTADGRPLFESLLLSSCAWAIGQTKSRGPTHRDWLSGFEAFITKQTATIAEKWKFSEDDAEGARIAGIGFPIGRPLRAQDITSVAMHLIEVLGWQPANAGIEIRAKSTPVSAKRVYSTDGNDFLNSFLLGDLRRLVTDAERGQELGSLLSNYLSVSKSPPRIDVRQDNAFVDAQLAPSNFPKGCWPSSGGHLLALSQQFAINALVQRCVPNAGPFAVNGPPGTGKSTLLRDVVAHVVVERAQALASLASAAAGITGKTRLKGGKGPLYVPLWDQRLTGHGIVVASSNNAAVNNITLELPAKSAIDARWHPETDYFRELASKLLGQDAWGLIAAKLGNKANRQEVLSRLLFGKTWGDHEEDDDQASQDPSSRRSLFDYLKHPPAGSSWTSVVASFKRALAEEDRIRSERQGYWQAAHDHPKTKSTVAIAEKAIIVLNQKVSDLETAILAFQRQSADATRLLEHRRADHLAHAHHKPAWWEWLLPWNKRPRAWSSAEETLCALERAASEDVSRIREHWTQEQARLRATRLDLEQQQAQADQSRNALRHCEKMLEEMRSKGLTSPLDPSTADAREQSAPWNDSVWHEARVRVFLSALALHQAFIRENAEPFRRAVRGILLLFTGQVTDKAPTEAIVATWEALFLMIPVVSTTFASVDRLFERLPSQSLGWLLIDEAGQATPQAAIGAMWRSRRAVVVGDPLQLEPVVTIPLRLQEILRNHFKVSKEWMPAFTSVQERTDAASALGTSLATKDGFKWIGAPLRVHRRCDDPVFSIANRIAYDGLMVHGVPSRQPLTIPASSWITVDSTEWDGHWCDEEGVQFSLLVERLVATGVRTDQIFGISPFRRVVRGLEDCASRWQGIRVGTVHTVQGREADVVILVLGGNPSRQGALQWASQQPNLLNVAITRAKRRLYVIGNRERWSGVEYFATLAQTLPIYSG